MKRASLYFCAPEKVEVRAEELPAPQAGQAQVQTLLSGISAGTEMLFYRGQVPADLSLDETIPSLAGEVRYPFKYGYASVGQVTALGPGMSQNWLGQRVFSFHPHESAYHAAPEDLIPLPGEISPESAVFLPNMETAVNFLQDGLPLIGEKAVVFGLGVVGLLTTALLLRFPLAAVLAFDPIPNRREQAAQLGAQVFDPTLPAEIERARAILNAQGPGSGADLVFEVSGSPRALDQALALAGFGGRVVIGSWYGAKPVSLDLGGRFHRSRVRLVASQVSSLSAELGPRWDKPRRLQAALSALADVRPERWISHRFSIHQAAEAYALLAGWPAQTLQVVLEYP